MSFIDKSKLKTILIKFLDSHSFNEHFLENIVLAINEFLWREDDEIYKVVALFNKEKLDSKYPELVKIFEEFTNLLDKIYKEVSPTEEDEEVSPEKENNSIYHLYDL